MVKQIIKEITEFETEDGMAVEGYYFNQKDILERIYLYYNSKYESGEYDDEGFKKYFYNICRTPCDVGTKAIDFDTKDIRIQTAAGGDPMKTWFFERDLKFWMKDISFGNVLNRLFHELPIFGSVVLKIIDGKPYFVDLRNFFVEQTADSLEKALYCGEVHRYSAEEFQKMGKENKWKGVDEALAAFRETSERYIKVYERYGEYMDGSEYKYGRTIGCSFEPETDKQIDSNTSSIDIILDQTECELPYREFHWEKLPGRWLGIGRVEIVFDPQMRMNELANLKVKSSYWAALRIFQTRDDGLERNLLTETKNGEILNVDSEIQPVLTEERNLHAYNQEETRWLSNRDEMTSSYDVTRGERLPAGTPLGAAQLATAQAGAYFDIIRETVAGEVKELLYKDIIPTFQKKNTQEHTLRIAGEDLDKLNNLIIALKTRRRMLLFVDRNKRLPSPTEYEIMKGVVGEMVAQGQEKVITIPKDFYKDIKYKIDIIITGEQEDTRVQAANLQMALQLYATSPQIMQDPVGKRVFYKMLEKGGLSPADFEGETAPPSITQVAQQRGGGGVSRPSFPNTPAPGGAEATI